MSKIAPYSLVELSDMTDIIGRFADEDRTSVGTGVYVVWSYLQCGGATKDGVVSVARSVISRHTCLSESTVKRALAILEDLGYIEVLRNAGSGYKSAINQYTFLKGRFSKEASGENRVTDDPTTGSRMTHGTGSSVTPYYYPEGTRDNNEGVELPLRQAPGAPSTQKTELPAIPILKGENLKSFKKLMSVIFDESFPDALSQFPAPKKLTVGEMLVELAKMHPRYYMKGSTIKGFHPEDIDGYNSFHVEPPEDNEDTYILSPGDAMMIATYGVDIKDHAAVTNDHTGWGSPSSLPSYGWYGETPEEQDRICMTDARLRKEYEAEATAGTSTVVALTPSPSPAPNLPDNSSESTSAPASPGNSWHRAPKPTPESVIEYEACLARFKAFNEATS